MQGLTANHIPLLFNEFVTFFLPKKLGTLQLEQITHLRVTQILEKLHHWLRQNRLTSFNLVVNAVAQ